MKLKGKITSKRTKIYNDLPQILCCTKRGGKCGGRGEDIMGIYQGKKCGSKRGRKKG